MAVGAAAASPSRLRSLLISTAIPARDIETSACKITGGASMALADAAAAATPSPAACTAPSASSADDARPDDDSPCPPPTHALSLWVHDCARACKSSSERVSSSHADERKRSKLDISRILSWRRSKRCSSKDNGVSSNSCARCNPPLSPPPPLRSAFAASYAAPTSSNVAPASPENGSPDHCPTTSLCPVPSAADVAPRTAAAAAA